MASARKLLIPVALVLFALSFYCFYRFDRHHARYVTTTHGAVGGHSMLEVILFFWVAIAGAACLVVAFRPRSSLPAPPGPARTRRPGRAAAPRSRPAR